MQIYRWLQGRPLQGRLRGSLPRTPSNLSHTATAHIGSTYKGRTALRTLWDGTRPIGIVNIVSTVGVIRPEGATTDVHRGVCADDADGADAKAALSGDYFV